MTTQSQITFPYSANEVRVVMIDETPWFVATDVCSVLDQPDTSKVCSRLDDDEKLLRTMCVSGQNREILLINESGLYSLILTSRKPEAKKFKKWVTNEVLPAIRKTGRYEMPNVQPAVELITQSQLDQIARLVYDISLCCHFNEKARHNTYAGIREQFGLENIHKLPAIQFEKVYGRLHVLHEKAREYMKLRCKIDDQFTKDVLRHGQMQIQFQSELFLPK